jgi:cell wall-associated NlpC family hydrolase
VRALVPALVALLLVPASAAGAASHLGARALRPGAAGHDVRVLQDLLGRNGFDTGVDGRFGPATRSAVVRFQRSAGLIATGVVGPRTVAALRQLVPAPSPGGAVPAPAPSPAATATLTPDGLAAAPAGAPPLLAAAIEAGNRIAQAPYVYGGGHGRWEDRGYDCSGSVSYALHGAGLLDTSLDSTGLSGWGEAGPGQWITIYANADHAYAVIAGLRFDTSGQRTAGTRWQAAVRSARGFTVRHPPGL